MSSFWKKLLLENRKLYPITDIKQTMKIKYTILLLLGLCFSCQEIDDINDMAPDRDDLITSGTELTATLEEGYIKWWQGIHAEEAVLALSVAGDTYGLSRGDYGTIELGTEPRVAYMNNGMQHSNYQKITELPWYNSLLAVAAANDVLRALLQGVTIDDGNAQDQSIRASAHLLRGLSWGYMGLLFYEGLLVTETTDLNTDFEYVSYEAMITAAVEELELAIEIAESIGNDFVHNYFNGILLNNQTFREVAHAYAARFLAQYPRTKAASENVDWEIVLYHAERGLQQDFAPRADGKDWQSYQKYVFAETGLGPFWARVDQRIVALFDTRQPASYPRTDPDGQIAQFQKQAQSDDARLASDFIFEENMNFAPENGTWHFSHYKHHRNQTEPTNFGDGISIGPMPVFKAADVQLLAAEAKFRLGAESQAIDILNSSARVARGNLPLLTSTVISEEIEAAIFYERTIELLGSAPLNTFFDRRRLFERIDSESLDFGQGLQIGTLAQLPVPHRELNATGRTPYTFGGANDPEGIVPTEL